MRINYEDATDAAYIDLDEKTNTHISKEVEPGIILDYDDQGNVIGIEIFPVSEGGSRHTAPTINLSAHIIGTRPEYHPETRFTDSGHAHQASRKRLISQEQVFDTIQNPDFTLPDQANPLLKRFTKKLPAPDNRRLTVIADTSADPWQVLTAFETNRYGN